jgi:hypothetical protein
MIIAKLKADWTGGERIPAWSHEVGDGPGREYELASVSSTVERLQRGGRSGGWFTRTHEVLVPDTPASPYADLDVSLEKRPGFTAENIDALVQEFIHQVCAKAGAVPGDTRVEVFDGSREGKLSRHVIVCGLALPSIAAVRKFCLSLACFSDPAFDRDVYKAWRTFRAPFSTSVAKGGGLKPPMGLGPFDPAKFERGLVMRWNFALAATVLVPADAADESVSLGVVQREGAGGKTKRRDVTGWTEGRLETVRRGVTAYLEKSGATVEGVAFLPESGELEFRMRGFVCAAKQDPHKSNGSYVHLRLPTLPAPGVASEPPSAPAHAVCLDRECSNIRWLVCDFGYLI